MKKGSKAGFVLQMIGGIGLLLYSLVLVADALLGRGFSWNEPLLYLSLLLYLGAPILFMVFAALGKKRVWPNVINLILSLFPLWYFGTNLVSYISMMIHYGAAGLIVGWSEYLRVLLYALPFVFILLGFIGSIVGIENVSKQKKAEKAEESAASPAAPASESPAAEQPEASLPPFKAKLLQKSADTVIRFENDEGESLELGLVDTVYFKENGPMQLYAVLQKEGEEGVYIAQYDEARDTVFLTDQETAERVLAEWKKGADSPQQNGAVQRAGGRLKLDIVDTIVYRSDWKEFRKRASQDELFALAVGSRYQLDGAKFYIRSLLGAVGGVLSIVLAIVLAGEFGWFAIIGGVAGYLFFNLMACKQIGYADTLSDCRWKLDSEHAQLLKDLFSENIFISILRQIILMALRFVALFYQGLLMFIGVLIPAARDWTVAHGGAGGAVISMPKGCDIGGLGAMGAYYASQKFGDVWDQHMQEVEAAKLAKFQKYTYTDQYGMTQEAYSDDGKTFYEGTNKLKEVGTSKDGGKTIKLK